MIALLSMMTALAGPVDLLVGYPFLRTPPVTVQTEVNDPMLGPVHEALPATSRPVHGSLIAEVELEPLRAVDLVLGGGVQGFVSSWEKEHFQLDARVWDIQLDLGVRTPVEQGPSAPVIQGYAGAGAGGRVSVFVPSHWRSRITPSPQGYGAVGLVSRGPVRLRCELRARLATRIDWYRGQAQLPEEALRWTYYPGGASLGLLIGVGWGGSSAPPVQEGQVQPAP